MFFHRCNFTIVSDILDKRPPYNTPYRRLFRRMPNIINFLKEVKEQLDKVVWPTKEQTIRYSILVILVAVIVGLFLGGLDYILTAFTDFLITSYDK